MFCRLLQAGVYGRSAQTHGDELNLATPSTGLHFASFAVWSPSTWLSSFD